MKHERAVFRLFSLLSLALLLLPALYALKTGGVSPVRLWTAAALAPLRTLARDAGDAAAAVLRDLSAAERLRAENEVLRDRLAMDEARLLEAERVLREDAVLREQLELEERYRSCTLCPARVLAAEESPGGPAYTLDRGTADGVGPGCAVLTREGLAGRIRAAGPDWSEMIPVTHRDFRAAVRLFFCEETGIAAGTGEALTLSFLPEDSRALPGERILTGGGQLPPGLFLGIAERITLAEDGLSCTAAVRPAAGTPGDRVFIVTDFAGTE